MFEFLKNKLNKVYSSFSSKLFSLFGKKSIDKETLSELESLLISSDLGFKTTKKIIQNLNDKFSKGEIKEGVDLKKALEQDLTDIFLNLKNGDIHEIILLTGINGSGKTTFAGKLSNDYRKQKKKVLLVAGDTFRAAATDQLIEWSKKSGAEIEIGKPGQDPSSVIYSGCEKFKNEKFDILIIDTSGRLQTKVNLMKELEKIKKVILKQLPENKISVLLTIDAMLGQNSFEQAKIFNESIDLDGLILTKMDGSGKAGIVFSIVQELNIPIKYICYGEEIEKIKLFDSGAFVKQLLDS